MCLLFFVFVTFYCVVGKVSDDPDKNWIISVSAIPSGLVCFASIGYLFRNGFFEGVSDALNQGKVINSVNWDKPIHYLVVG